MKIVKHSKINEDIESLMKDNNKGLKKDYYVEPRTALSPTYARAIKNDEKIEAEMGKTLKDMAKRGREIEVPTPGVGKQLKNKYTAKEETKEKDELDESLFKEELGQYSGEEFLDTIAYDLERGDYYGEVDDIPWTLTINGRDCEDFESTWLLNYILEDISYAVKDGHLDYNGFETFILMDDIAELSPNEQSFIDGDLRTIIALDDDDFGDEAINFWYDWDIDFDVDAWERQGEENDDDFEEDLDEATKQVEELPDTVYELVYDRLFPAGVKNYRALILKDDPMAFEDERFYNKELDFYDIGVAVKDEEEADFVKKLADKLQLEYEYRPRKLKDDFIGVAVIHMDEETGETSAEDYAKKIGIEEPIRRTFKKGKWIEGVESDSKEQLDESKLWIDFYEYKPWSGAVDTYEIIRDHDKLDALDAFIEEMYDGEMEDGELNDLLWFESDYVLDALGISLEDEEEDDDDVDDDFE